MYRNSFVRKFLGQRKWLPRIALMFAIILLYVFSTIGNPSLAYADSVPGGNISNPVVRAVDIAKPAVVRIITTVGGRITVHFTPAQSASFPLNGSSYKIKLSGSGAFITAHGDILTADHVIKPPHDQSLDLALQIMAAPDIAKYINQNLNPIVPFKKEDVIGALSASFFISEAHYDKTSSEAYFSTDFTGPLAVKDVQDIPANTHAAVDKVEAENSFNQGDLAIIHVNMDNTPSLQLSDSSNVAQQDELTIIGFPGNADLSDPNKPSPQDLLTSSVNKLYVSALRQYGDNAPVIQVGGNVEHGDSGGPALDSNGMVVGVVSFSLASFDSPGNTSFLQASASAQKLIRTLRLNTAPGPLQKAWSSTFADYVSTTPGHWHQARTEFQQIAHKYPQFMAIGSYLAYTNQKAIHEPLPKSPLLSDYATRIISIGLVIFLLIVLAVVIVVSRRKKISPSIGEPYIPIPSAPPVPQGPLPPAPTSIETLTEPASPEPEPVIPAPVSVGLDDHEDDQAEKEVEQSMKSEQVVLVEAPAAIDGGAKTKEEAPGVEELPITDSLVKAAEELSILKSLVKATEPVNVGQKVTAEEPTTGGLTEIDKEKLLMGDLTEIDEKELSTDDEPTVPSLPVFGF